MMSDGRFFLELGKNGRKHIRAEFKELSKESKEDWSRTPSSEPRHECSATTGWGSPCHKNLLIRASAAIMLPPCRA